MTTTTKKQLTPETAKVLTKVEDLLANALHQAAGPEEAAKLRADMKETRESMFIEPEATEGVPMKEDAPQSDTSAPQPAEPTLLDKIEHTRAALGELADAILPAKDAAEVKAKMASDVEKIRGHKKAEVNVVENGINKGNMDGEEVAAAVVALMVATKTPQAVIDLYQAGKVTIAVDLNASPNTQHAHDVLTGLKREA